MKTQERRFKILYLLVSQLGVPNLERQMAILAAKIDAGDPQVNEALTFYENKIIEILETPTFNLN